MARPFELNALEAVRRFVHLEEHHHRDPADELARQNEIGVAVAKIERSRQLCRLGAELLAQCSGGLSPVSLLPNI